MKQKKWVILKAYLSSANETIVRMVPITFLPVDIGTKHIASNVTGSCFLTRTSPLLMLEDLLERNASLAGDST